MKRFPELDDRAQRGSKPRCHLYTDGTPAEVAGRLTALVKPYGSVAGGHRWLPDGFVDLEEVRLDRPNPLIAGGPSSRLAEWWFEVPGGSGPYWDLASEFMAGAVRRKRPGILLVEAKAHTGEIKTEGKKLKRGASADSRRNHERIGQAIEEANEGLQAVTGIRGWGMSRDRCYQMANRFAWAWKLASLGIPVVLVYLGFLDAVEMSDEGGPFLAHADWVACVKKHGEGAVPEAVWDRAWETPESTLFTARILSVNQSLTASRMPR